MATPVRVYFFHDDQVTWYDQGADGHVSFFVATLEELWPDLPLLPPRPSSTPFAPEGPIVQEVWPVTASVLRINDGLLVDVRRGVALPWAPFVHPRGDTSLVISWDAGPILWVGGTLHDTRTGVSRPAASLPLRDPTSPVVAIPGEPVRQILRTTGPPQVSMDNADPVPLGVAFHGLALDKVDQATVMFGDFDTPASAAVTAAIGNTDLAEIVRLAQVVSMDPAAVLAVLYLLSRLSPGAYHPDGYYGLAQLSAGQLVTGGWTDAPELLLQAGVATQLEVFGRYLGSLRPGAQHPGELLAELVTVVDPPSWLPDTVVVAAPVPARLRRLVPAGADHIRLGDLDQAVAAVVGGVPGREFAARLGWGFVEPAGAVV